MAKYITTPITLYGDALIPDQQFLLAYSLGDFVYIVKLDTVTTANSRGTIPIRPATNQILCPQNTKYEKGPQRGTSVQKSG